MVTLFIKKGVLNIHSGEKEGIVEPFIDDTDTFLMNSIKCSLYYDVLHDKPNLLTYTPDSPPPPRPHLY